MPVFFLFYACPTIPQETKSWNISGELIWNWVSEFCGAAAVWLSLFCYKNIRKSKFMFMNIFVKILFCWVIFGKAGSCLWIFVHIFVLLGNIWKSGFIFPAAWMKEIKLSARSKSKLRKEQQKNFLNSSTVF